MLYQITQFLLNVTVSLLAGACLLRLYMQWQRVGFRNPLGQFVMAVSNWAVLPLRRVLPAIGRLDSASLAAAALLELAMMGILWLLQGGIAPVPVIFIDAAFDLLGLAVTGLMVLLLVYALMSWMPTRSALDGVFDGLCAPLLAPFRSVLPRPGGFDLSPLVLLVILQVITIVLRHLQSGALGLLITG